MRWLVLLLLFLPLSVWAQEIPANRADLVVNFTNFQNALGKFIQDRDEQEARLKWVLDNWVPKPESPMAKSDNK